MYFTGIVLQDGQHFYKCCKKLTTGLLCEFARFLPFSNMLIYKTEIKAKG